MKTYLKALLIVAVCLLATGCADSVPLDQVESMDKVGFFYGLWHGMIAPFAFLCSLFMDDVAIYALYNSGGWYDFGFILGVGGTSCSCTKSK
jgi:hypothetical protein